MKPTTAATLVAFVLAVVLSSSAAAGPNSRTWAVAIDAKVFPLGSFVLTPKGAGPLGRDSGSLRGDWRTSPERTVTRNGLKIGVTTTTWALTGARGKLTIREQLEWVDLEADANRDGQRDGVAAGTWTIVRGTGAYARVTGNGRSGHAGLGSSWNARYEGLIRFR